MDLNLKQIIPYLIHNVEVSIFEGSKVKLVGVKDDLLIVREEKRCSNIYTSYVSCKNVYLVLRPLKDFEKEVQLELNEQIIIAGERFYDVSDIDHRTMNQEKINWFLSRHYDIYGLIPLGLAKDIKTF